MTGRTCRREREVLRVVARDAGTPADPDVLGHAETCARCREVRAAAEALRAAWLQEAEAARVPPAAAMWWRLDRRVRLDRARRVQHATWVLHGLLVAAVLGAGIAVLQMTVPWLSGSGSVLADTVQGTASVVGAWSEAPAGWAIAVALIVAASLLVPAALYLGFADD